MATIKPYTDLDQSKKLAEILPLESADMKWFVPADNEGEFIEEISFISNKSEYHLFDKVTDWDDTPYIPCWSLAALLDILPKDKSIDCAITFGYYNGKGEYIEKWLCAFEKEGETTDDFIIETIDGSNPVDACYEMILKLHKLKLL